MCFWGVCECECIYVCILGLKWISVSVTRLIPIDVIFFLIWLQFLLIFGCCDQCHSVNRSTRKSLGRILICIFLVEDHLWRTAAARPPSTLRIAKNAQPACLTVTFELLCSTHAFSCQCHGRGLQHWLFPGRHPLSAAHSNPTTTPTPTPPPPQQSQTNDFDLSSAVRGRSYRYNPPNDVKDLSAKLMNDKTSPPPSTPLPPPPSVKTPLLQAKKIESQETLLISSPCILTLTFLNRSSSYKGQSSSFCVLKCG